MNPAQEILINEIHGGTLKLGASQYIGTAETSQPFDPDKESVQIGIVELVGSESDPNTWEEYPTSKVTVKGAAEVVADDEVLTVIVCNLNAKFQISVKIENEQEFEYKGMYLLSTSPFKLLTKSTEYTTEIEDNTDRNIGIICERKS